METQNSQGKEGKEKHSEQKELPVETTREGKEHGRHGRAKAGQCSQRADWTWVGAGLRRASEAGLNRCLYPASNAKHTML